MDILNVFFSICLCYREPPRDGAYVDGLFLEGARWDKSLNSLTNSKLKELFFEMPLIHIKATTKDKQELRNVYECPIYRTRLIFIAFARSDFDLK